MILLVGMLVGGIIHLLVENDENDPEEDDDRVADNVAQSLLSFDPTVFFVVLLPPIIFNSGYHIRCDLFWRYSTPIVLYSCLGTVICTLVVATLLYVVQSWYDSPDFSVSYLELLAFGALISATDPVSTLAVFSVKQVDPHLFYLVFGESVMNDAVGLVLFEALAHVLEQTTNTAEVNVQQEIWQFLLDFVTGLLGSLALGTLFGLCVALVLKHLDLRHTPLLELCSYVTIMYFPFVVAEVLHLSGIVTVLFTGMAAKRYAQPNLSAPTATHADTVFRMTAHLTETSIFLELGLSVFGLVGTGAFHWTFMLCALAACFIGRACNIYPITLALNCLAWNNDKRKQDNKDDDTVPDGYVEHGVATEEIIKQNSSSSSTESISDSRISWNKAHMLWFSGLRGAVSYALVRTFPRTGNEAAFVVTTMFVVLVTTFVLGGGTEAALNFFNIPVNVDEKKYLESIGQKPFSTGCLSRFERDHVRRWVLRDCKGNDGDTTSNDDDDFDPIEYQEHIELTEVEHFRNIQKDANQTIYDYGQ